MKKIIILYSAIILIFSVALLIEGCSKVEDNLVTSPDLGVHSAGWLTPSSPNFHGNAISAGKWDMSGCKKCHGMDYKGGGSGSSCLKCHSNSPEACNTCHGNSQHSYPPAALNGQTSITYLGVGVHDIHLGDSTLRYSAKVDCFECHRQFNGLYDTIHINPKNIDNRAEIVFDSLSKTRTGNITPNPVWNRTTATCSGVYCHGDFKNGTYRLINPPPLPVWTNQNSVVCGSCHGNPTTYDPFPGGTHPGTHYDVDECYWCHQNVIDENGNIFNKSLHINGVIDIGER